MPELATPAATSTDSAPVTPFSLADLTPEERQTWREKGTIPEPKPKTAAPAPAKEAAEEAESATAKTDATGSEPEKTTQESHRQKTKADTDRRFREILDENKSLKQRLEALEQRSAPREEKQTSQPAAAAREAEVKAPTQDDKDDKGQFKYATVEDFYAALAEFKTDQRIAKYKEESDKAVKAREQAEQHKVIAEGWSKKVEAARAKYDDFDAIALNEKLPVEIKTGSVVDLFTLDSPHGADVLYHLTKNDCVELARVSKLNPIAQARELTKIELQFAEKPKENPAPQTRAPKPPSEVGGRGTQPDDPGLTAARAGDFRSAKSEWNRKAIASAK